MRDLNIIEEKERIILKDMKDFEPKHIFECGQAFRWNKEENGSYTIVHKGKILNVSKIDKDIILDGASIEDFNTIWFDYFDLGTDYGEIKEELKKDSVLKEAIAYGEGIRLLNQDPFETTISFIISANNQIPRIKNSIELISKEFGQPIGEYNGKTYYEFPDAEILSKTSADYLKEKCKVGFRGKYIVNSSKMIANGELKLEDLYFKNKDDLELELRRLPGVGPKVSNCISLFSLKKKDSFPVDVWVKRIMEHFYFKEETSPKKISEFAKNKFKSYGGYAQQYLFYYAREEAIGK